MEKKSDKKLKVVYNDHQLLKYKKKKLHFIKRILKKQEVIILKNQKKQKDKKRDLYGKSLGYAKSILEAPEKLKEEKKSWRT